MTANKNKMFKNIGFRVSDEEYEEFKHEASKERLSLSTWIVRVLLEKTRGRAFNSD